MKGTRNIYDTQQLNPVNKRRQINICIIALPFKSQLQTRLFVHA